MTTRKQLLNNLLDIGGVATLNNLYSPSANSYKGSLLFTRKLFKDYLAEGLIEKIEPIGKPMNKSQEVFYCMTKKGAKYIGRTDEYKYKKYQKSPDNVMHESMKFDVALSMLRNFQRVKFTFRYDSSFYGVQPDILIRIESTNRKQLTKFILVEIERKKTVDRVFNEKIKRYEAMFEQIKNKVTNYYKEHFFVFSLDTRNNLIAVDEISVGMLTASLVHPREAFETAIKRHAAHIIIAHNHPTGETEPSEDDLKITKRLVDAGKVIGIEVLDHLIVTKTSYLSFKEKYLI